MKIGIYLKWKQASGASYNQTQIYRAGSQTGTFALIATQSYDNVNYYDIDGTTSHWYKIRFYDSVLNKYSDFSDAFQGGTFRGYCTVEDIRDMSNLTSSDITDANIARFIQLACQQVNQDVSVYIEDEQLFFIDNIRANNIDGTNTSFYTWSYPIGDLDNNFVVNIADLKAYEIDNNTNPSTRTALTVTSLDSDNGNFVVSTAPSQENYVWITYRYVPLPLTHPLIRQAAMFLTAAWAYQKINVGKAPSFKIGNITMRRDMDSFRYYYNKYKQTLLEINNMSMVDIKEAPSIPGLNMYERNPTPAERSKTTTQDKDSRKATGPRPGPYPYYKQ